MSLSFVNAFEFNGTVRDVNGLILNNTIINITIRDQSFNIVGYNTTTSNGTGWFNLTVSDNTNWFYQPVLQHFNGSYIDFIGQNLPAFPYQEVSTLSTINFYLRYGGTINITAINSTGSRVTFNYMVKDTKLGFPIESNWQTYVSEKIIYVPSDRNYSVMIFPQNSMPVSYDLNNLSSYDNKTFKKQFNTSMSLVRVSGYINDSGIVGWDEFRVVPLLLEPGNMIFMGGGGLPYNMSSWDFANGTDMYNLSTGFYNITLPGPAESATYILFATARNGSLGYGSFKNITTNYGDTEKHHNLTMYGLFGSWGTVSSNITLNKASDWSQINISSAQQTFNLINSTNSSLSQLSAHVEVKVDYSNYGAIEFTFMEDISQSGSASFSVPLLNMTGIKDINIYSQMYAPKRVSKTASQIQTNNNITMTAFNPGDIEGGVDEGDISVAFYTSNSTCDVPTPPSSCSLGDLDMENFNPLTSIIGGGRLSFRMGTGNIKVHYVNVDMLASGPPDAAFDDSATTGTSGDSFASALRFGSMGPTIYDYVFVSVPYSETAGSGLDDTNSVNMSIPVYYDENWNVIWNTTSNGTSASSFAANYSHYSTHASEWSYLMNQSTCTTNTSMFNLTNPCYINTASNVIWVRLPHFSGIGPSVSGSVVATTTTTSPSGSSSSSNAAIAGAELVPEDEEEGPDIDLSSEDVSVVQIGVSQGQVLSLTFGTVEHSVTIQEVTGDSVTLIIESDPIGVTLTIGETKEVDVDGNGINDLAITLNGINNGVADLTFERLVSVSEIEEEAEPGVEVGEEKEGFSYWWLLILIVVIVVGIIWYFKKK